MLIETHYSITILIRGPCLYWFIYHITINWSRTDWPLGPEHIAIYVDSSKGVSGTILPGLSSQRNPVRCNNYLQIFVCNNSLQLSPDPGFHYGPVYWYYKWWSYFANASALQCFLDNYAVNVTWTTIKTNF